MLEEEVLSKALAKKNKEIDEVNKKYEDMKRDYESKIKNLMNSINVLQKKSDQIEKESHENVRVDIIKNLRKERKDQEQVITLLRKFIGKNDEVDKYLINEFKKGGDQRMLTYEELKMKYNKIENDYKKLKNGLDGNGGANSGKGYLKPKERKKKITDSEIQVLVVKQFKRQIGEFDEKIKRLEEENSTLKQQKERMETVQNEMFEKLKNYNTELGEIKSVYDIVKKDIKEDSLAKINEVKIKLTSVEQENEKLKERIKELIKIGEENKKKNEDKIKKLQDERDINLRLLDTMKTEVSAYKDELKNFRGEINKIDSKGIMKIKRLEDENENIIKNKNELQANMNNLNDVVKQKDIEIKNLNNNIEALKDQIKVKEAEIKMLTQKIAEFERILQGQNEENNYAHDNESSYSKFS